jgi:hypothetical protein
MHCQKSTIQALGQASLATLYIVLVATFFYFANTIFGQEDTFVTPIAFLLLFVLSAAIMGALVLGRPLLMYLDNQKKEALKLFGLTLAWLFVYMMIAMVILWFI